MFIGKMHARLFLKVYHLMLPKLAETILLVLNNFTKTKWFVRIG